MKIFVIGFMGSGKSYWGRKWSQQTGLHFYDLDEEIEKAENSSITDIFSLKGEQAFRQIEQRELRQFANRQDFILSCGGGTPCFFDNMKFMKQMGSVLYLRASPRYILMRVANETDQRPLLKGLTEAERYQYVKNKIMEREPVYLQASHVFNVEELDENTLRDEITQQDA